MKFFCRSIQYLDTYEDVLGEVFGDPALDGSEEGSGWASGKWGLTQEGSTTAWARLGEILGESESISDSESITTIGDLAISGNEGEVSSSNQDPNDDLKPPPRIDENLNDWEHMSPKEMRFLGSQPGSPGMERNRRRSSGAPSSPSPRSNSRSNSSSSPLRPVLSFGPEDLEDDGIAVEDDDEGIEDHLPQPLSTPKAGGIDEVSEAPVV